MPQVILPVPLYVTFLRSGFNSNHRLVSYGVRSQQTSSMFFPHPSSRHRPSVVSRWRHCLSSFIVVSSVLVVQLLGGSAVLPTSSLLPAMACVGLPDLIAVSYNGSRAIECGRPLRATTALLRTASWWIKKDWPSQVQIALSGHRDNRKHAGTSPSDSVNQHVLQLSLLATIAVAIKFNFFRHWLTWSVVDFQARQNHVVQERCPVVNVALADAVVHELCHTHGLTEASQGRREERLGAPPTLLVQHHLSSIGQFMHNVFHFFWFHCGVHAYMAMLLLHLSNVVLFLSAGKTGTYFRTQLREQHVQVATSNMKQINAVR